MYWHRWNDKPLAFGTNARGRNRLEGSARRRGKICRERNRKSGKKLARSAHLPQHLANQRDFNTSQANLGSPRGWTQIRLSFLGVAKSNTCIVLIHFS